MKKEDKELLLKDLCARLPYGVKYMDLWNPDELPTTLCDINVDVELIMNTDGFSLEIEKCKPYLFPLSIMTKEQYEEWCNLEGEPLDEILTRNANGEKMSTLEHHLLIAKSLTDSVNYCYKNHFDIYGLIPMGLAEDATGKNIY
jgi:hypothetical protein